MLHLLLLWLQVTATPHVTYRDEHGRTALQVAAATDGPGKLDLVRLRLAKGADPNVRDEEGASPLDDAVWRGSLDFTIVLLDGGARVNAPDTKTGATPLNEAAFRGHGAIAQVLLNRGADTSIKDNAGFVPAENALRERHPELLGLLLQHERDGGLPVRLLAEAVRRGQEDGVQVLLDLGVRVDSRFSSGSTALYEASLKGDSRLVALLLDRGADVNGRELTTGTTPIYAAAAFGRRAVVSTLLLWGADPRLVGKDGVSPLRAAASNGFEEIARELRKAGAR